VSGGNAASPFQTVTALSAISMIVAVIAAKQSFALLARRESYGAGKP